VTATTPKLLLCFDGSAHAEHAIEVAGRLFPGATAQVLHVWEPVERIVARYAALAPFIGEEITEADEGIEASSSEVAAAGVSLAGKHGIEATAHVAALRGTVWEAVLDVADAFDADVIVTGTRSLHGVREAFSGTLSHALLQHSTRAVLAVPVPEAD
jgi:nucleotide-binding universal stress UspA family protein